MGNCKLLVFLCFYLSVRLTNGNGLEFNSPNNTNFLHSDLEKRQERIYNDTIKSWISTNFTESTTEKWQTIKKNDIPNSEKFKQITNVFIEGRQDVPATTPETDHAGLMDIPAGSVTNSVSGLSACKVVGKLADVKSCRHKCGQKQQLPCSCDLKCLVYKNCCEDMLTECPEVVKETRTKFGHLLNVNVVCSENRNFVITECGTDPSASITSSINMKTEPLPPNNSSAVKESRSPNPTGSSGGTLRFSDSRIQSFIKMRDAYVTDKATGFTYKNMDIFSCNARAKSVPVEWSTVYREPETIISHTTLGSIAQALTDSFSIYPETETVYIPRKECERVVKTECVDKYKINESKLEHKCKEFISYARITSSPSGHIYGNKYCALCILGPDSTFAQNIAPFVGPFGETELMLQGFTVKLSEQIVVIDTFGKTLYPWKRVTCRLPDTNPTEPITGDIPCVINRCNDYVVLRHDGVCKNTFFTSMAVADETFPLTRNEYEMFPKFARCFLELHNNVDIDGDFTPTVALFQRKRNMVIYATDLFYYETTGYNSKPESHIIHHIMLMAKVFKLYRATTPRPPHTFNIKHSIFPLATFIEKMEGFSKTYYASNNPNNVTVCFCAEINPKEPNLKRLSCVMSCVQDNVDVQAVSGYPESPCFSVFNVSTGRARVVEFNVASIFVLVSISTFVQLKISIFMT